MIRAIVYKMSNRSIGSIYFGNEVDEILSQISEDFLESKPSCPELIRKLDSLGLSIFVDLNYEGEVETLTDYFGSNLMEINVTPFSKILSKSYVFKFSESEIDKSNILNILNLSEVSEIMDTDESLMKLVSQILLTDSSWDPLLSYLTEKYGFEFNIFNYVDYDQEGFDS